MSIHEQSQEHNIMAHDTSVNDDPEFLARIPHGAQDDFAEIALSRQVRSANPATTLSTSDCGKNIRLMNHFKPAAKLQTGCKPCCQSGRASACSSLSGLTDASIPGWTKSLAEISSWQRASARPQLQVVLSPRSREPLSRRRLSRRCNDRGQRAVSSRSCTRMKLPADIGAV